ncbi:MAG: gluconate 2-dehydrogenase subunit 3 family protein [Pseudomonadaceae bacterium]|nr:gluconate 2-dehydrogenase subunit 3 family protein [Pseudomonadaceae bacterium]
MATSENTNSGQPNSPSRREVIRNALLLSGYTSLVGTGTLATGCATTLNRSDAVTSTAFSVDEIQWLDEVAETILPETDTPGAKAAEVGAFIAIMVTDTYSPEEQALFHAGTRALESECVATYGTGFMGATASQRLSLLERLDQEQITYTLNKPADSAPHYFHTIKQLTAFGYFTSEIGYTQALRYVESPGRFDPCVEYTPGERAWARHA